MNEWIWCIETKSMDEWEKEIVWECRGIDGEWSSALNIPNLNSEAYEFPIERFKIFLE